jgi:hypothetical protein
LSILYENIQTKAGKEPQYPVDSFRPLKVPTACQDTHLPKGCGI